MTRETGRYPVSRPLIPRAGFRLGFCRRGYIHGAGRDGGGIIGLVKSRARAEVRQAGPEGGAETVRLVVDETGSFQRSAATVYKGRYADSV